MLYAVDGLNLTEKLESDVVNSPDEHALSVRQLDFYYGGVHALTKIDLSIPKGKVTAMIGASGSGKSTLLRTFNQMYRLYPEQRVTGEILFHNRNLLSKETDIQQLRKQIGMVFQKPTPFPLSIFDNIAFAIKLHESLSKHDLAERVEEALTQAALWDEVKDKLKTPAIKLSGGQQQRLCIARTIATKPEILLLDEPTSALDPKSTRQIEALMLTLKNLATIVLVTHNLAQARRISDDIAFLHHGELIEVGPTEVLFTQPKNVLTQQYLAHGEDE